MLRVTTVLPAVSGGSHPPLDGFELGYVTSDGAQARIPLVDAWALRLEAAPPARSSPLYKGQRNFPGRWWSATDARHVGYESRLEHDHLGSLTWIRRWRGSPWGWLRSSIVNLAETLGGFPSTLMDGDHGR
jgi:hypothetical protein